MKKTIMRLLSYVLVALVAASTTCACFLYAQKNDTGKDHRNDFHRTECLWPFFHPEVKQLCTQRHKPALLSYRIYLSIIVIIHYISFIPICKKKRKGDCLINSKIYKRRMSFRASAQRIKISMIAGGNHTLIQCGLVRNDILT